MIDDAALQGLLEQLLGSQAKHDQRLAELEQQENLLRLVTEKGMNADPVLIEVLKTLAVMAAAHYREDDALVFAHPQSGGVLDHSALVRRFKNALKDAGVREVRFNDLRHTFGTRMAAAGVPMRTLQEWDGPPRRQDDDDLCRLRAQQARERDG